MTTAAIAEHMEVVGSDGHHVGKVDHVVGQDIELAKLDLGATAVAAPIRDPRGHPIAALTLAGLSVRMQPKLDEAVPAVLRGAQAIADRMGSDSQR